MSISPPLLFSAGKRVFFYIDAPPSGNYNHYTLKLGCPMIRSPFAARMNAVDIDLIWLIRLKSYDEINPR